MELNCIDSFSNFHDQYASIKPLILFPELTTLTISAMVLLLRLSFVQLCCFSLVEWFMGGGPRSLSLHCHSLGLLNSLQNLFHLEEQDLFSLINFQKVSIQQVKSVFSVI